MGQERALQMPGGKGKGAVKPLASLLAPLQRDQRARLLQGQIGILTGVLCGPSQRFQCR